MFYCADPIAIILLRATDAAIMKQLCARELLARFPMKTLAVGGKTSENLRGNCPIWAIDGNVRVFRRVCVGRWYGLRLFNIPN